MRRVVIAVIDAMCLLGLVTVVLLLVVWFVMVGQLVWLLMEHL